MIKKPLVEQGTGAIIGQVIVDEDRIEQKMLKGLVKIVPVVVKPEHMDEEMVHSFTLLPNGGNNGRKISDDRSPVGDGQVKSEERKD